VSCSARRWFSVRAASRSVFGSLGADAQRVAGSFQGGNAGAGGGCELFEGALVVVADAGGLGGCGSLGVLGAGDGGGLGLAGAFGVLLGRLGAVLGVGDLASGVGASGADVAVRGLAGLPDFLGRPVAGTAYLRIGSGPEFGQLAVELFHAGGGLSCGVVGLLAVGLHGVPLGLGVPAALDLFGAGR
jgi:hypothetical protein